MDRLHVGSGGHQEAGRGVPEVVRAEVLQPRFLTREQVERLAEAAGEYGDAVGLLAYTGLRFGERRSRRTLRRPHRSVFKRQRGISPAQH